MDLFSPTGKVSKTLVHFLRWTTFPGGIGILVEWIAPYILAAFSPRLHPHPLDPCLFHPRFSFPAVVSLTTKDKTHQKKMLAKQAMS